MACFEINATVKANGVTVPDGLKEWRRLQVDDHDQLSTELGMGMPTVSRHSLASSTWFSIRAKVDTGRYPISI
jgi:hypothetical protein